MAEPRFHIGDIVEVTLYGEWKGIELEIVQVTSEISNGHKTGRTLYSTWQDGEGMTTDWEADHLRLIRRPTTPADAAHKRGQRLAEIGDTIIGG